MRGNKGFTLIELMIVVAIIAIIAAIAIPNLMRARATSNETAAIGALRTISSSEASFQAAMTLTDANSVGNYAGSLTQLGGPTALATPPYIDEVLAGGIKSGYTFAINTIGPAASDENIWYGTAVPLVYGGSGTRSFYVDQTGVIRGDDTGGNTPSPYMEPGNYGAYIPVGS